MALVVGISGVTNGGKSTLCKNLLKALPLGTKLIMQDDYFYPENSPNHIPCPGGVNHHNWDSITAIDMDQMVRDISTVLSNINKGFYSNKLHDNRMKIDFNSEDLELEDGVDFDAINKMVDSLVRRCNKRRGILLVDGFCIFDDPRLRQICDFKIFVTLDKETAYSRRQHRSYDPPDPPRFFDVCVWPMYEMHLNRIKQYSDVYFYDGVHKLSDLFIEILKKICVASNITQI